MKSSQVFFLILLITVASFAKAYSQTILLNNAGINIGLSFNVGSTVNRIGFYAGGFYCYDFIQINPSLRAYYNFTGLGPSIKGLEFQPSIGIISAFGSLREEKSDFFYALGNQTGRKYALGYSLNFYFDQIKTSQRTGTILIGIDRVEILHENDVLATQRSDRFRTGGIKITYQKDQLMFGISSVLWTGNPQSNLTIKVRESDFPSRFGYVDFSAAPYGRYSNGLLALQFKYAAPYGQTIQFAAGIDAERVRNTFQNKIIHDMYFWPKKWNKARNPHLPMLDTEGGPYLYKAGQRLKPAKFYWDLSLNPTVFY